MGSIDEKNLELEVKHKVDGSWHPCRVSLSTDDSEFGIIVNFANSDEQDVISNREDAIARLRFRSTTVEGGECSHIKEGDCVLAMYKDQFKSMFFDAMIEKPNRVRHSNRVFCRCTFEIKWLNPDLEEETTIIPSKSIMKLSRTEIVSHPIVAAFLNSSSPKDGAEASSFLSLLDQANYEVDVEGILEKQIEELSKLADGSMDCSTDLLEVKRASHGGQKQSKAAASTSHNQSNRWRSTRSQNKEQVEVEVKKVPEDDKPFLTPLAARAALASLIHEHEPPMQTPPSLSLVEQEPQEDLVRKDSKKQIKDNKTVSNSIGSTNVSGRSGRSTMTRVTRASANKEVEVLSDEVKGQSLRKKLASPVNSTRKTRSAMYIEIEASSDEEKKEYSIENTGLTRTRNQKERSNARAVPEESEGKIGSSGTIVNNSTDLTSAQSTVKKVTSSSVHKKIKASSDAVKPTATRKTRLTMHKEIEEYSIENTGPTRTRNQKEQSNTHGVPEESEGKIGSSRTIVNNPTDLTSAQSTVKKVTRSLVHQKIEASSDAVKETTTRATRSSLPKETEASSDAVKPSTTRVTRHSVNREIEALSDAVKQEFSSSKVFSSTARSACSQNQMMDMIQDTVEVVEAVTPGKSESKKRSSDSPVDPNKRIRTYHDVTATTEESGAILESNENASGEKKSSKRKKVIASEKPKLRSSPRFDFLPRARSQK